MSEQTPTALLPCPMCGEKPWLNEHPVSKWWEAECEADAADGCGLRISRSTRNAVINAWNTRATPTPAPDAVAEGLDWKKIAKLAGEHGVRYRTNSAMAEFLAALPASQHVAVEGDAFAFRQARSVAVDEYGYDSVLGALSEIPILQAQVATLTARVETLEGAGQAVVDEFPAASGKYSDLEGADGKPGWGSIRRLSAALSPDPAVKPSAEGGAA